MIYTRYSFRYFCLDNMKRVYNARVKDTRNTEELGKVAENAVCMVFHTMFSGLFSYDNNASDKLKGRFEKLPGLFNCTDVKHTARDNARYDMSGTTEDGATKHLSVKTVKTAQSKVCPQVIGQSCHNVFCDYFKLSRTSEKSDIKKFILDNVASLLYHYYNHTFDCDIFYYNEYKDKCLYIRPKTKINWDKYRYEFTRYLEKWNESTTLHIVGKDKKPVTIGEFQIHNHRDGIKFRWNFENLLRIFAEDFDITEL